LLSGLVFPIQNMPVIFQWITYAIPLRYGHLPVDHLRDPSALLRDRAARGLPQRSWSRDAVAPSARHVGPRHGDTPDRTAPVQTTGGLTGFSSRNGVHGGLRCAPIVTSFDGRLWVCPGPARVSARAWARMARPMTFYGGGRAGEDWRHGSRDD
jgi:hypothetical protein